ncbi:M14 family zinc carboxypeptidase [Psychroserpens jangbogonensis]|uniref:M14 family zinc carboxypeptidase n=1 Tax=Psychroserpens jangbogonensis TaxID=1484460 RepID=UPI00053CFE2A|nr:M14 family zinc carboxypeptidase [Psychroserpens jangbogonensis]
MKRITLTLAVLLTLLLNVNAQNSILKSQDLEQEKAEKYLSSKGELTFTFQIERGGDVEALTRDMSLVNYDPNTNTVKAWANEAQFRRFVTKNIPYSIPKSENEVDESVIYDVRPLAARAPGDQLTFPLASYPTYAEYAHQMQHFEDDNFGLVEMVNIGATHQGDKDLLFVKISDNVATDEQEPKLMLTSSMHGDEIAGYPMMLSLIDYILTVYNNTGHSDHARIKNLVENAEIWINPSANPDGTYHNSSGNTSVTGSRRGNALNIDLNRNYPDNVAGAHPDTEVYQTETLAFMAFAEAHNFVLSANFHGGTELVNYPFDNAYSAQYIHADNDWFEHIGIEYATHCQTDANAGPSSTPSYSNKASYMTDDDDWDESAGNQAWHNDYAQSPGVTHGAEWYRVYGGRQDYMNFYEQCREITIELSDVKILAESSLVDYWYYNRDALLDFLTQGTYGFRGIVADATNPSLEIEGAKVTIVGHDDYGSEIYTDVDGDYYRPIKAGTYDLLFEAPCYQPVTVSGQSITDGNTVVLANVLLTPLASIPTGLQASNVSTTSATLSWDEISGITYDLRYREQGEPSWTTTTVSEATKQLTGLTALTQYEVQVRSNCGNFNSAYSSSVLFTTSDAVACVGTLISSFPYLETFDSGLGDWTQDSGDSGDWSLDANGTPSNNTGPSDDNTGNGNYLFTEASSSGVGSNATVILTSSCFDLTNFTTGSFSFYYHMFGTDVGTLNLEISSDNGDNWTNIFTESGNLGNQWNTQNIDLSSYFGETVKFRFTGITGNGWSSDIAIDHIVIVDDYDYCASNGNDTSDEYINRVQLNTLDNNNSGVGTDGTGYSDFTDTPSLITNLLSGTQYTITVSPDWPGNSFNEGYSVWIDYNHNGDFSDSGEQVWTQAATNSASVSGTFTLPTTDINYGETRMRVSMKYDGIPTECESFGYGEVEDYKVNIVYDGLLFTNNTWIPSAPNGTTTSEKVLLLDGIYNVDSAISVNNIIVNSGATINVEKGQSVAVALDIRNFGEFILNSDSDEFSSLIVEGSVAGDVKYNRHVTSNAGGNDIISPPVSGESFTSFISNNSNILSNSGQTVYLFGPFEKPINHYQLFSNVEAVNLEAAKGYRTGSTDGGTFTFSGSVTTGSLNVPIVKTGIDFAKWNLIGNPYTSYIKLEDFLNANLTELDAQSVAIYGYDADITDGSVWTIWNVAYSKDNPNTLIAPGQGFFVSSKDGGSNVSFTPSMRTTGSTDDFIEGRNADNTISHFVIKMTSTDKVFGTDIYFIENASLGLDIGYDAELFEETPLSYSIYSELTEGSQDLNMAIQSIGFDDVNGSTLVPLGINLLQGQQVSISMDTSDLDYDVYLEDTLTNTVTLLNTSEYNLTADTDLIGTGRFYIRFEAETLSIVDSGLSNVQVFNNSDTKQIIVKGPLTEDTSFILYDIQGREIIRKDLNTSNAINIIDASNYSKGVYLVQLTNTTGTISKKLIIR